MKSSRRTYPQEQENQITPNERNQNAQVSPAIIKVQL
jgi:hypothetical protein